ncbi:MAG: aromatic hydrocarbon degradation protein [Bacteroidota bacterium]|nr:aromatic hydrocarbon degradation protein [Bacteroidota bacterium]
MKKKILIGCSLLSAIVLNAQEPADALRFSWTVPSGTARQQAIGGAMGSLGGDLSALYSNPAGLGFYRTGDLVISPLVHFGRNKATYFNRLENENNKAKGSLGTSGFVIGTGREGARSAAFGIGVNRSADFNSMILYRGQNNQSSYSQKFLEEIRNSGNTNPNTVASNYPFGTSLAFNTYWIDTVRGSSGQVTGYKSLAPVATGLLQQNSFEATGGITELALGGAINFNEKVLFGGSFGVPILRYARSGSFTEADATNNANNNFNYATFRDDLTTEGAGINVKAGFIFKPIEYVRLGLAFHSPTLYSLTDRYSASVETDTENYGGVNKQTSEYVSGSGGEFKYQLVTPYRVIGSASYVLREIADVKKQKGFLTADIEYVNYKASSFQPDEENGNDQSTKDYLKTLNRAIDNAYKSAVNVRVGGELKFTTVMVRAGAAYYGNPYKNIQGEKGNHLNLSGGLGYRNKGVFVDLTYVHSLNKDVHFPYRLQYDPYSGATIKNTTGNVLMTVGFKF